jgi:hypothetical protein
MSFSRRLLFAACLALAVPLTAPSAAVFKGRHVDDRWYDGQAVSTTYGAYTCRIKFHGDQVFLQMAGIQIVAVLDEEIIADPHEIVAHDPRRGVDWTIDCYNLGS